MKIVKYLAKVVLAGVVAIVLLSIIVTLYYLAPLHYENPDHNTDYVWKANAYWSNLKEGFSFGRYDAKGFNNYSVVTNPDVIVLGSSHIQGSNIMQGENLCSILSSKLNGEFSVYNMGVSGHNIYKVCHYLPQNLDLNGHTPKAIIIETSTIELTQEEVDKVLSGNVSFTPSHTTGIMSTLQRIPFLRLLYTQMENGLLDLLLTRGDASTADESEYVFSKKPFEDLFGYIQQQKEKYGAEIIIFYHPRDYYINDDGKMVTVDSEALHEFADAADRHGIVFLDLTNDFVSLYETSRKLPHGFANGEIGVGHLNPTGHALIAERLYEVIEELAEEGKICR